LEMPHKKPLLSPKLLLFLFTMILANISGVMSDMLLPLYVQDLGASVAQVGLFFSLGAILPLAFQIVGGWLSDTIGRLQAIAIGSMAGVIEMIVAIIAPSWEWLFISIVGAAVTRAFIGPSFRAFIAEETDEENLGKVYGMFDALFMVVGVIGPLLGGYLVQGRGFRQMYAVAAAIYITAAVIRVLMARHASKQQSADSRERPTLAGLKTNLAAMIGLLSAGGVITWIFISDGLLDVSYRMSEQLMPLYQENIIGLTYIQIGWLASIQSVVTMLFVAPGGWFSDKASERVAIILGGGFVLGGWLTFVNSRAFIGCAVAWALFGAGMALFQPAYSALISKAVPERLRGTAFGLFSTSLGIISLPAPWIGAQMWELVEPRAPFFVPLVAVALLLPVVWFKLKLEPSTEQPTGSTEAEKFTVSG
jgi:MFS family permease